MVVRLGILGCARVARAAVLEIVEQAPELAVRAIASRSLETSRHWAKKYGIDTALDDYAALIDRDDIDAVYVPLPNSLHAAWAIRALESGKAVLCEKPLAANVAEATAMVAAARRTGQQLVEAFHYRYHPLADFIDQIVRGGELGQLLQIEAAFEVPGALVKPGDIRLQRGLAGGALMDVGAYCVNALRWVGGHEPVVERATAQCVGEDIDGAMTAHLVFEDGIAGSIRCSLIAEAFSATLVVKGSQGVLAVTNPFLPQLGHEAWVDRGGVTKRYDFGSTPTYVYQARAFAASVEDGTRALTDGADGVLNMQTIDAIYHKAGMRPRG